MNDGKTQIEKVAGSVADGASVDWLALTQSPDATVFEGLERIDRIRQAYERGARSFERGAGADSSAESSRRPLGEPTGHWGEFELFDALGWGSQGTVVRAYDPSLDRCVALKLSTADGDRLLVEGRRLAHLHQPNVLTVYGADRHDGRVGVWAELLEGRSLEEELESRGRLSPSEVAAIGAELCRGLAALHAEGLLHGDVKAANVMRTQERCVLVDLGSSKASGPKVPTEAAGFGSPLTAAPELIQGGAAAPTSDLYSLGALLYRLVSGEHPIQASNWSELKSASRRGARPLRDLRPGLPEEFVRTIEAALATEPAKRISSAGEFERRLAAAVHRNASSGRARWPWAIAASIVPVIVILALRGSFTATPMQLESALFRRGVAGVQELRSGDELQVGDALYLDVQLSRRAHLYVLNEDDAGQLTVLFPIPGADARNPLAAGVQHRLPGNVAGRAFDWQVTSASGKETVVLLASPEPIAAIETALRELPRAREGEPLRYARLSDEASRGIAGLLPAPDPGSAPSGRLASLVEQLDGSEESAGIRARWIELHH